MCYSSKDAETIYLVRMTEDAIFGSRQLELLLFGDYKKRIKVRLFMDSESTLESIASSRQIERKTLQQTVVDLKEGLVDGDVLSYSWLPTGEVILDLMTKEAKMNDAFEDIIRENIINI